MLEEAKSTGLLLVLEEEKDAVLAEESQSSFR
jgi:hypothetical protein